jgi:MFS family permease
VKTGVVILIVGLLGLVLGAVLVSMALFLTMLIAVVLGFSLMTTSLQALISKRSRPDQQGGILGVNQSGSALARILGPVSGIWLFGRVDPNAPYGCSVLLLGISLALLMRIPRLENLSGGAGDGLPPKTV